MDGEAKDACSIAVYAALNCTKVPKLELIVGESGEVEDFDLCGDFGDAYPLECSKIPIILTILKVDLFYASLVLLSIRAMNFT